MSRLDRLGPVPGGAPDQRDGPDALDAPDATDRYEEMLGLAGLLDRTGEELRRHATAAGAILRDPDVADTAVLSPRTWTEAEDDLRAASDGTRGLLARSRELEADALVLRATVLTYRWIDELQAAAYETLGSLAGRALGYLAPEVALGGAVVSAGLIETDALDRDGVATYLGELAGAHPDLMEHLTSGGGGLLDGLTMRSLLTAGALGDDRAAPAARAGLRALGVGAFEAGFTSALRDAAGGLAPDTDPAAPAADPTPQPAPVPGPTREAAPAGLADLMAALEATTTPVDVRRLGEGRFVAFLAGPAATAPRPGASHLRLVGGDSSTYAADVVRAVEDAVGPGGGGRVMLVGAGVGGVTAAELASGPVSDLFVVEQVVTSGAPSAHVPRIPDGTRVLSLEDRSDPVALLGSLVNAGSRNRVTVVFDGDRAGTEGLLVAGGRAADDARHPDLVAEIARLTELGYLTG